MILEGNSVQYKIGKDEIEISEEDLVSQLQDQGYILLKRKKGDEGNG